MSKKIVLFGGTGGVGKKILNYLSVDYDVMPVGSKDIDLTSSSEVKEFFEKKYFDIVLNFSANNYDCFLHKYDTSKQEYIDRQIDVNIRGNINILSNCLPKMRENKFGRVIAASSILAKTPLPGTSIYSASKSFLETLYKCAALENSTKNITCNTIQMGYFDAGLVYKIPEEIRLNIINKIPNKRLGSIEELYKTIDFLIKVPYVNGSSLSINGGLQ